MKIENTKTNDALHAKDENLKLVQPLLDQLNIKANKFSFSDDKNEAAQHLRARLIEAINNSSEELKSIKALVNMANNEGVFSSAKNAHDIYKSSTFNELVKREKRLEEKINPDLQAAREMPKCRGKIYPDPSVKTYQTQEPSPGISSANSTISPPGGGYLRLCKIMRVRSYQRIQHVALIDSQQ